MAVTPSAAPNPAYLKGNWLVTGALPLTGTGPPAAAFGLAVTLNIIDGQVAGDVSEAFPCSNGTAAGGAGILASVPIATDGSFVLSPQFISGNPPTLNFQISGVAPTGAGQSWSGTYTATNANFGCAPVSGTFTAMPIQPVSGTYAGQGVLAASIPGIGSSPNIITLSIALQQGSSASLDTLGSVVNSVNALSGSIQIQGSPCFTTGSIVNTSGDVLGNFLSGVFTMDDGSKAFVTGRISNLAATTIQLQTISIMGGKCDGWFGFSNSTLTRQ